MYGMVQVRLIVIQFESKGGLILENTQTIEKHNRKG